MFYLGLPFIHFEINRVSPIYIYISIYNIHIHEKGKDQQGNAHMSAGDITRSEIIPAVIALLHSLQ